METLDKKLSTQHRRLKKDAKNNKLDHRFAELESLLRVGLGFKLKNAKKGNIDAVIFRMGGEPLLPARLPGVRLRAAGEVQLRETRLLPLVPRAADDGRRLPPARAGHPTPGR